MKKEIYNQLNFKMGVITEAIKILDVYDMSSKVSMNMAIGSCRDFLKENFDIGDSK